MTDIQQWRRMIQPVRSRTPAEELDGILSPTTPRRGLKPKLSSYFNQQPTTTTKVDAVFSDDLFNPTWPSASTFGAYPSPHANNLIDSVMCRLLGQPYDSLDSSLNATLLQIFEHFRNLDDEHQKTLVDLEKEVERRCHLESAMQQSAQQWNREKQDYKAEVKRLELILANGSDGLVKVTSARQDSVLRNRGNRDDMFGISEDRTMETIFEFLERSKRYEDKMWSSQRGEQTQDLLRTTMC